MQAWFERELADVDACTAFGPRDRPETGRPPPVRSPSSQRRVEGPRTVQLGPLPLRHEPRTHGMEKRPRLAGTSASGEQLGEVGDCAQLEEPRVLRVRDGDRK